MARVKRGIIAHKTRKRILKRTKGFRFGRKSKERAAKEALLHAGVHSFRGRKEKKRVERQRWQVKVNAAARGEGTTYSALMRDLKKKGIALNRKMLAEIAEHRPETWKKIVAAAIEG
ncbi:MAG: 50S ribosomal protein L20 [Candidatus Colwellbacteria bacterium]|nr:50S ribosomal protein L20 [Candidatus Colwellbacteria bacterium]